MKQAEIEQINKIIQSLDTAVGMLLVPAMNKGRELHPGDIKTAMEKVSQASFLLGQLIE